MLHTVGWDIGGAHVKAALIDEHGCVLKVYLEASPLWKGLDYLDQALKNILTQLPVADYQHAMTMTGELVDLFASRDDGVEKIIKALHGVIGDSELLIYRGQHGFIKPDQLKISHTIEIASANWMASASWAAQAIDNVLFVDVGSTTTDILLCQNKVVDALGLSDYQRLQSQELIYTGIVRTAVMALTQTTFFKGQSIGIMAEYFATMADVYRLTGELNEAHDKTDTADGQPKTLAASAKRLARMIAYDFTDSELGLWKQFALTLKSQQKQQIQLACQRQLSRDFYDKDKPLCLMGAGIGRFLVKQIALDLKLPYQDFSTLFHTKIDKSTLSLADCAPAVAVGCLRLKC
ncbi:MAG: hydantoinase/oxoprolinase family protein [Methylococcales bacterium]|nr:hydantoinase/oxoprolinase family protein [Methylococcales bacterium]